MRLNFKLPVNIIKQGKRYAAYTPALDIATGGKTEIEVKKRFEELVQIFFEELSEAGTLEEVLSELGWKKLKLESKINSWQPPKIVSRSIKVNIPVAV